MKVASVSVCLCTYNRAERLAETLAAMQAMEAPRECHVELLVVDNNSTDDTRAVVAAAAARPSALKIGYTREARQGKSFALNHAMQQARGDVLALTDDDVIPAPDWLSRIVETFRARDVTFVFGKVLPRWAVVPPPELLTPRARDIWGPLALLDYGDEPAVYVAESTAQRLPIGANLAFARAALITIGGWRTDLGKVNNTLISGEDHEIFMRLRRHGLYGGYYDPALTVRHYVPASRLTRSYFRRWFYWHGKTQALMLDDDLFPGLDMSRVPRIAGVPRFLYRHGGQQLLKYARTLTAGTALDVLVEELRLLKFAGLYGECWRRALFASHFTSSIRGANLARLPHAPSTEPVQRNAGSVSWHSVEEGAEKC